MTHVPSPPETAPEPAPDATAKTDRPRFARHPPERRARIERMRIVNVALLLALIALGVAWELVLAPLKGGSGGALAWKVLPLTFAIAGMLKHKLYTYRWMSLLVWLYFTEGVVRAAGDGGMSQVLAGIEVALSVGLFAACAVYVRLRLGVLTPEDKAAAKAARAQEP